MATTDDKLVTAKGLAQSLGEVAGGVVLYNDRSGTNIVSISEPVTAFSAIEVTVVEYNDAFKSDMDVADFTMVHPEAYDEYRVAISSGSDTITRTFSVSGDGKTIKCTTNSRTLILRMVGYR